MKTERSGQTMRVLPAALAAALTILALACSSGGQARKQAQEAEFYRTIYARADLVLEATRKALGDYDLEVTGTRPLGPRSWSLTVKRGRHNDFPDDLEGVLIRGTAERETRVGLVVPTSFHR